MQEHKSGAVKPWSSLITRLHTDARSSRGGAGLPGSQQPQTPLRKGVVAEMQMNDSAVATELVKALATGSAGSSSNASADAAFSAASSNSSGSLSGMSNSGVLGDLSKSSAGAAAAAANASDAAPSGSSLAASVDGGAAGEEAKAAPLPTALATWNRGDWVMMAKCLEIATSDAVTDALLSVEEKAHATSVRTQLVSVLESNFNAMGEAVASCTIEDWEVVNKAMELASKDTSLSIGERAHAKVLLEMLITTETDMRSDGGMRRNPSVSSNSSEEGTQGDLAKEWARQVAKQSSSRGISNPSSRGGSAQHSPSTSGSFPRVSAAPSDSSGNIPIIPDFSPAWGDVSAVAHELNAVQTETLEGALLTAVTMCSEDKTANGSKVCNFLLSKALAATDSTMGFISSLHFRPNGAGYLKTHAMTNVAWTPQLKKFFEEKKDTGLVFSNLDTLVGAIVKTGRLVITNDTSADPRSSGVPPGHPKIQAFMGMPLFLHHKLIGAIAVSNRVGGYTEEMADQMESFNEVVAEILGHYLRSHQEQKAEGADKKAAGSGKIARDAVLSFSSLGLLSTMNKAAVSIFGHRTGEHVSRIFFLLGDGDYDCSPAGLNAAAAAGKTIRAAGVRKDGQGTHFEMLVTRGFSETSQYVLSLWESSAGQAYPAPPQVAKKWAPGAAMGGPPLAQSPVPGADERRRSLDSIGSGVASPKTGVMSRAAPASAAAHCPVTTKVTESMSGTKKQHLQSTSLAFRAYEIYESDESPNGSIVFKYLLSQLLHMTESSMGLISSVHERPDGEPYTRAHAMTNVAWTRELRQWYDENWQTGLIFSNMNSLVGSVVSPPYEPIITNNPRQDPRSTGVPPGHPVIKNYMGVPLFHGGELVGMWAVCNSRIRYSRGMLPTLEPLTKACADLMGRVLGHVQGNDGDNSSDYSSSQSSPGRSSNSGRRSSFGNNLPSPSPMSESAATGLEGLVVGLDLRSESSNAFPAEWNTDVGPQACPYLGHRK